MVRERILALVLMTGGILAGLALPPRVAAAAGADQGSARPAEGEVPEKYLTNYPAATKFSAPVQGFFDETARTFDVVRGRQFTHKPNGGYGLPVVMQVEGKNLLHVGADVGWHRVGAPVYAVAAGVVRLSEGPSPPAKQSKSAATGSAAGENPKTRPHVMAFGNLLW